MDARRSEIWFFVTLLAVAVFLAWLVFAPYLSAIVLAGTLAFLFQPLYRKSLRMLRNESTAALATVLVITLIVFLPLGFFGVRIFGEATALYTSLASHGGFDLGASLAGFLRSHFEGPDVTRLVLSFDNYVEQALTWLIQHLGSFFSGIAQVIFMAFISILGLYYFLKDGERLKEWLVGTIPLAPEYIEEVLHEMETVGSSVLKGTLVIAIVQGIVMGIGFYIFNIPGPTFWGALTIPVSIVPVVGTWLVVVPAAIYLFITGQTLSGVGFVIWSAILVNLVYNLLSPQLMRRGAHIHPYLILLSVLGGLSVFGPIGFLIGPLVLALLLSLLKIYPKLVAK